MFDFVKKETCGNCKNYLQHYVKIDGEFVPLGKGDCLMRHYPPKIYNVKRPTTPGCTDWKEQPKEED